MITKEGHRIMDETLLNMRLSDILLQFADDVRADIFDQSDLQGRAMAIVMEIRRAK